MADTEDTWRKDPLTVLPKLAPVQLSERENKVKSVCIIFVILIHSYYCHGYRNLREISPDQLPAKIVFKGNVISCVSWEDSLGKNYLIVSESKEMDSKQAIEAQKIDTMMIEADMRDKELYAYNYLVKGDSVDLLWKLIDFVRECPFDLTVEYLTKKPLVTDIDNDGISETWLVYWLGCRSDVSALDLKLIMHIGKAKYAIRGTRIVSYGSGKNDFDGGKTVMDNNFDKVSKGIKEYSNNLWQKYQKENQ